LWWIFAFNLLLIIAILLPTRIYLYYTPSEKNKLKATFLVFDYIPKANGRLKLPSTALIKTIIYILSRSSVVATDGNDDYTFSSYNTLFSLPILFGKYALLTLIKTYSKSFVLISDKTAPFCVEFSFSLFTLFISSFKLLYYIINNKLKRIANEQ